MVFSASLVVWLEIFLELSELSLGLSFQVLRFALDLLAGVAGDPTPGIPQSRSP